MKAIKNIFTIFAGALFEPGGFSPIFLLLLIVAIVANAPAIFLIPFGLFFGSIILANALLNKNFWQ